MYTGVAVIIVIVVFIVVVTIYQHYVLMYYQCTTDADIWCWNDWTCEADPDRIGSLQCAGGSCREAINNLYLGDNSCANSCSSDSGCGCVWPEQFQQQVSSSSAPCSMSNFSNVGIGTFICGGANERCPQSGEGCNPDCIEYGPGCCEA